MYIDQKNLYFNDMNSNIVRMTQEDKIYNLGDPKLTVMSNKIKPQYIYIGIASVILIIILNNK